MLARIGVLNITGVDDKIFNTSDLNSQCMSHSTNIFENKALETKKRIFTINPNVYFIPVFEKITSENAIDILAVDHSRTVQPNIITISKQIE